MSGDQNEMEHYTEQVVLFDGQAISFPSTEPHPIQSTKLAKGDAIKPISAADPNSLLLQVRYDNITGVPIGVKGSIYLCFQNSFKIHPVFDSILIRILQIDQVGHVVLQAARDQKKTMIVINRIRDAIVKEFCYEDLQNHTYIKASLPCREANSLLSRIHFIPRVKSDKMELIFAQATVVLHPFPFGGSKTASDVFKSGVPLVTYPQPYLRGTYIFFRLVMSC